MANTYVKIASSTVGSGGVSSISFTSIPSTYTDLVVKLSARTNGTSFPTAPWQNLSITLNGSSVSSARQLYGTGAGVGSDNNTSGVWATTNNATSNTFSSNEIYLPNYTGSNAKVIGVDNATENNGADFAIVLWGATFSGVTSAVTSLTLTPVSGNLLQYTTAYLYGISKS